jgi:hypothetical protein
MLRFLHRLEHDDLLLRVEQIQLSPSPIRTSDPAEAQPLALTALAIGFAFAQDGPGAPAPGTLAVPAAEETP